MNGKVKGFIFQSPYLKPLSKCLIIISESKFKISLVEIKLFVFFQ